MDGTTLEPSQPYALWLLPAQPWADELAATIAELAHRHKTRAFLPHVTLCSGPEFAQANPAAAVEALARRWSPLQLQSDGLLRGDDRFTLFYLRLHQPPGADLIAEAQAACPASHGPAVGLHLSLLYDDPSPDVAALRIDRHALAAKCSHLHRPQGGDTAIGFDRLALVQPGPGGWIEGWPWRIKANLRLVGR